MARTGRIISWALVLLVVDLLTFAAVRAARDVVADSNKLWKKHRLEDGKTRLHQTTMGRYHWPTVGGYGGGGGYGAGGGTGGGASGGGVIGGPGYGQVGGGGGGGGAGFGQVGGGGGGAGGYGSGGGMGGGFGGGYGNGGGGSGSGSGYGGGIGGLGMGMGSFPGYKNGPSGTFHANKEHNYEGSMMKGMSNAKKHKREASRVKTRTAG